MVSDFQGALIAAGRGERLRHTAQEADIAGTPKPLVELAGEPLLIRQAKAILAAGARGVMGIVNSETARLIERRGIVMPSGVRLIVRDTANSMESLLALGEHIETSHFLAATVDAVMHPSQMREFAASAAAQVDENGGFDGALGVVQWRGDARALFAQIDQQGLITALDESESRFVTAGVYFLPRRMFDFAQQARAERLQAMRRLLAMLLRNGARLGAIEMDGVIDVDEAVDLEAARKAFGGLPPDMARKSGLAR